jgi:hypothetical protein
MITGGSIWVPPDDDADAAALAAADDSEEVDADEQPARATTPIRAAALAATAVRVRLTWFSFRTVFVRSTGVLPNGTQG